MSSDSGMNFRKLQDLNYNPLRNHVNSTVTQSPTAIQLSIKWYVQSRSHFASTLHVLTVFQAGAARPLYKQVSPNVLHSTRDQRRSKIEWEIIG